MIEDAIWRTALAWLWFGWASGLVMAWADRRRILWPVQGVIVGVLLAVTVLTAVGVLP